MSKYRVIFGPYFPVIGLNTEGQTCLNKPAAEGHNLNSLSLG